MIGNPFIDNYKICPSCGEGHDDGGWIKIRRKEYYICLDCLEDLTTDEIKEHINQREKNEKKK